MLDDFSSYSFIGELDDVGQEKCPRGLSRRTSWDTFADDARQVEDVVDDGAQLEIDVDDNCADGDIVDETAIVSWICKSDRTLCSQKVAAENPIADSTHEEVVGCTLRANPPVA
jgi:hypothetical protein